MSATARGAKITYFGHSTVAIEAAGTCLLTDPLLREGLLLLLRRRRPLAELGSAGRPDAILVSHLHQDHLDFPTLRRLPAGTPIVAPSGSGRFLARGGFDHAIELAEGDSERIGELLVTAVPARHSGRGRPGTGDVGSLGYVIDGGARIYFAGDTDLFDGMHEIGVGLDLALIPIGGWGPRIGAGHLDPVTAAEALVRLRPRIAVPIHWGTYTLVGSPWLWPRLTSDPGKRFAEHAARIAPEVEVRVLEPGQSLQVEGVERDDADG